MINPSKSIRNYFKRLSDNKYVERKRKEQNENNTKAIKAREEALQKNSGKISEVLSLMSQSSVPVITPQYSNKPYIPPSKICSDSAAIKNNNIAFDDYLSGEFASTATLFSGLGFPGFPYLTELTQITEYRDLSERTAKEMTRKWIKFRTSSKEDRGEQIYKIEAKLKQLKARDLFQSAAAMDGFMGRCQIFMDLGDSGGNISTEVSQELETPLTLSPLKIKKDSIKALKLIEPITTYPASYNASWPLKQNYYVPEAWWVYGQKVHRSRLLTFVSRPLPDLLKPVYNFSGMSLSQLAQPYVDYWLSTRNAVGKLLKNYSTTTLKINLQMLLQGNRYQEILDKARFFTGMQDSQGIFLLDSSEELEKIQTNLSGLEKLQSQAQEHMAAVAKTPLTILLGITPSGLNPTNEGDLKVYYSYIHDMQECLFRENLEHLIKVIMLSEFGEILEDLTFDFEPLFEITGKEQAAIRKSDGETDSVYAQTQVFTPQEIREKVASDPTSGYNNIDVSNPKGGFLQGGKLGQTAEPTEQAQTTQPEEEGEGEEESDEPDTDNATDSNIASDKSLDNVKLNRAEEKIYNIVMDHLSSELSSLTSQIRKSGHYKDLNYGLNIDKLNSITDKLKQPLSKLYFNGYQSAEAKLRLPEQVKQNITGDSIYTEQARKESINWAKNNAAKLITGIDQTTKDNINTTITKAMTQNWSVDKLATTLSSSHAFSASRARMVALTESRAAKSNGQIDSYRLHGITKKSWLAASDACDECVSNEADGPIDINASFSSGDDVPPLHPNCNCSCEPEI